MIGKCIVHAKLPLVMMWAVLLVLTGCQQPSARNEPVDMTGEYLAHVELNNTTLIASEIVDGLEAPRDITFDSEGWIWVNEIRGSLYRVNIDTGEKIRMLEIPDVHFERARGLLSTALHPNFPEEPYVYLHYTFAPEELGSRIVRYTFTGDTLTDQKVILEPLPGGYGHSGSKMMTGADDKLWLVTGDAHRGDLAQDPETYHGKVLRMNFDGSIPGDNPIEGSRIWTTGHRNMQGITHGNGHIYVSEHGPANDDEVNLLQKGGNYGWPDVEGYCDTEQERQYCSDSLIVEPMMAFNPVVAPSGVAFYGHDAISEWSNSLLLASLRIQTLRVLQLNETGEEIEDVQIYFQQQLGRLRDVIVDPQGRIFLLTSNTDWYREARPDIHDPDLAANGDRIIMLSPADEALLAALEDVEDKQVFTEDQLALYLGSSEIADDMGAGEQLYLTHCSSCHLPDGTGMEGVVPALVGSEWVSGDREELVNLLLYGVPDDEQPSDYEWDMPTYGNLSNDEIAGILNFIRGEFSSEQDQFTPADIQDIVDSAE